MNTPKRPKTAYGQELPYYEQKFIGNEDPYANPDLHYIPNAPPWLWTQNGAEGFGAPDPSALQAVLSPSSSCGSPDSLAGRPQNTNNQQHSFEGLAGPTTPSTTKDRAAIQFPTPTTSTLPDFAAQGTSSSGGRENKRGRPRSESLTNLMIEGSTSPSSIKCKFCHRVFPREKSLAAHLRTHTGELLCNPPIIANFHLSGRSKPFKIRPAIKHLPTCERDGAIRIAGRASEMGRKFKCRPVGSLNFK